MRDGLAGGHGGCRHGGGWSRAAHDRLEVHLGELGGEVLPGEEVEQRRVAVGVVGVEVAADRDRALAGDGADVGDDLVECALAAAQRPLAIVRRLVAVERDLGAGEAVGQQPVDDLGGEEEAVGDDADGQRHAARPGRGMDVLGEVVDDRQVEQRLAAEEHHGQAFRADRVELTFGVRDHLRRGLERHLVGVAVVIVVIALEAVAAGEVALQRGQDGEAKVRRVVPDRVEVGIEGAAIGVVALDDEAELGERGERLAFLVVERAGTGVPGLRAAFDGIEQRDDLGWHDDLGVGQRVHQEHV